MKNNKDHKIATVEEKDILEAELHDLRITTHYLAFAMGAPVSFFVICD